VLAKRILEENAWQAVFRGVKLSGVDIFELLFLMFNVSDAPRRSVLMTRTQTQRTSLRAYLCGCLAAAIVFSLTSGVGATSMGTKSEVLVSVTGTDPDEPTSTRTEDYRVAVKGDNTFSLEAIKPEAQTGWTLTDLRVSGNIDPFASLNYAITNNAGVTLLFTVSVTVPVSPQGPATVHGGSMGQTLTDANFNGLGAVATSGGLPLYQGQIDGATVLSIYPDPYLLSVPFAGASVNVPAVNVGLPGPTLPSGPALSTIGIINRFTLTPGDIFSGNSFFVVLPVPEPNTLALLALCVIGFAGGRR
jgi:hypothetical protein